MKGRISRDRYLSDAELEAFMRAVRERRHVNQPRDHAFFALLVNTGIRPSEAMALTREDIHLKKLTPWIRVKRVHPRHAPQPVCELVINPAIASVLAVYLATERAPKSGRVFPFTKRQSARLYHYHAKKAGIVPARKIYALRHSAGKRLMRATGDLRVVQAIMGHVRLKATMAYEEPDRSRIVQAQTLLEAV